LDRKRVIGIDPGIRRIGYAVIEVTGKKVEGVVSGSLNLPTDAEKRISVFSKFVEGLLNTYKPYAVAVEDVFSAKNPKVAFRIGEVKGILKFLCLLKKVKIFEYPPAEIKKRISGNGLAKKEQMRKALKFWIGDIKLPDAHSADAIAVALHCIKTCKYDRIS
jgi:crossover junction endodeoxyribonuclease RuvC